MKILLTGGSGMVGRNILEHSESLKYEILAPSRQELNLLDRDEVRHYFNAMQPDMIIHAAGRVGGIQDNISNPVNFLIQNLEMGLNVISTAAMVGVPNLLNFGSSCMYPRDIKDPLKESDVLKGELEPTNEGYALAKIVSAKLCEYISAEDLNKYKQYKTIIPCNLYGRYDTYNLRQSHLIPSVIRKLDEAKNNETKDVDIWGDGTARREFMYVGDLVDFVFFAIDRFEEMPKTLNVGIGKDYSINEYYETAAKVIGFSGNFKHDLSKPVGMKQKLVDVRKLNEFGWHYKTNLSDGIRKAYKFYQEEKTNGI